MKVLLILTVLFLSGCSIEFNTGNKYPTNGIASSSLPATSVKYRDDFKDSLRVRYKGEQYIIAIPNNKIRFSVICKTSEDIILQSFDKTKILIFVLKTKTWVTKEAPKDCP
ncbi:MAG: hypothetical protein AAB681_01920 [Patescibacteria group bacterium]